MKRILFFVANSVTLLFVLIAFLSLHQQTYAQANGTCTTGCISAGICIAANGLQHGSGTCTGQNAGLVCCMAAAPTPTPVIFKTCPGGESCSASGAGGCAFGVAGGQCGTSSSGICCNAQPAATSTPLPTATRVPTPIPPTATRIPPTVPPLPTSQATPTTSAPTPTGTLTSCSASIPCPNGGTCSNTTGANPGFGVCIYATCSGGTSCHNPINCQAGTVGAVCAANGSQCCVPMPTPTVMCGQCIQNGVVNETCMQSCQAPTPTGVNCGSTVCSLGQSCASPANSLCENNNCDDNQIWCNATQQCTNTGLGGNCIPLTTPTPVPTGVSCNKVTCPIGQVCADITNSRCAAPSSTPTPIEVTKEAPTATFTPVPTLASCNLINCPSGEVCTDFTNSRCGSPTATPTPTRSETQATQAPTPTSTIVPTPTTATCASENHICFDESTQWCTGSHISGTCSSDGTGNLMGCCDSSVTNIPTGSPVGQVCNSSVSPQATCYAGLSCPVGTTQGRNDVNGVCGTSASCCSPITPTIAPTATATIVPNATATLPVQDTTGPGTPSNTPVPTQVPAISFTPSIQEGAGVCTAPGTALHVTVSGQNTGGNNYTFTATLPNNDGTATGTVNGGFQTLTLPDANNPDAGFYETNAQISVNFTVTLSGATVYTGSMTINNTCQQTPTTIPTNTPTNNPTTTTPTTSPSVSSQFNMSVHLHDIGDSGDNVSSASSLSNKNPVDQTIAVTLGAIGAGSSNNTFSTTGTLYFNGNNYSTTNPTTGLAAPIVFSPALPNATYAFKVISPKYLSKQLPNVLAISGPGTYTLPDVSLTAGDVNLDNQLTILDYTTLLSCMGGAPTCDTTTFKRADLNDDGVVNLSDMNLFLRELSVQPGQ